jgi:hypothetical protein
MLMRLGFKRKNKGVRSLRSLTSEPKTGMLQYTTSDDEGSSS